MKRRIQKLMNFIALFAFREVIRILLKPIGMYSRIRGKRGLIEKKKKRVGFSAHLPSDESSLSVSGLGCSSVSHLSTW